MHNRKVIYKIKFLINPYCICIKKSIKNNNLPTIEALTNYKTLRKVKTYAILLKTAFLYYVCLVI